jgi:hypothetical protein
VCLDLRFGGFSLLFLGSGAHVYLFFLCGWVSADVVDGGLVFLRGWAIFFFFSFSYVERALCLFFFLSA